MSDLIDRVAMLTYQHTYSIGEGDELVPCNPEYVTNENRRCAQNAARAAIREVADWMDETKRQGATVCGVVSELRSMCESSGNSGELEAPDE